VASIGRPCAQKRAQGWAQVANLLAVTRNYRVHIWEAKRGKTEYRACIVGGPHWAGTANTVIDALAEIRLPLVRALDAGTCDSAAAMSMLAWIHRQRRKVSA
jgi:hypothetical protein